MSRRHDQSFKLLFSLPLAVEQTIRHFINSALADDLDFERMDNLATERTTPGLIRSHADLLWKIHFRGSARYLILLIEFQSTTYRYMPARILYYVAIAFHVLVAAKARGRNLVPGGLLPPTLAVTIYNGRERWTAPDEVLDLIEPTQGWLASRQPRLRHEILDLRMLAAQGPTEVTQGGGNDLRGRGGTEGAGAPGRAYRAGVPSGEAEIRGRDGRAAFRAPQ